MRIPLARTLIMVAAMALVAVAPAVTLSFSATDFQIDKLGWDGTQPGNYDILTGTGLSGSVSVPYGVPTPIATHDLVFDVGINSQNAWTPSPYSVSYDLTIEGVTKTITHQVNVKIGLTDDLDILPVSTVFHTSKGIVVYTSNLVSFRAADSGQHYKQLTGQLETVPEPATLALAGLGLATALRRRRR
ncbi:MAG: PEP-CTERM sorting domain-containing protein [Armatimonadetes bacterium]|nr:PEP-CTERM sorting domain-containing protein [Armatimonadota bacterium]MCA1996405.1 PEP-CTERM sorting domain-containing protein [Armatimonadota bacterium]